MAQNGASPESASPWLRRFARVDVPRVSTGFYADQVRVVRMSCGLAKLLYEDVAGRAHACSYP